MNHPPLAHKDCGGTSPPFSVFFLPCLNTWNPPNTAPAWFSKVTLMTVSNVMSKWFLRSWFFELLTTILECAFCFLAGKVKMYLQRYVSQVKFFFSLSLLWNLFSALESSSNSVTPGICLCLLFILSCQDQNSWFILIYLRSSSTFE